MFTSGEAKSTTILLYIIGSNLESDDGCATDDIKEMLKADLGDDVTIVLQTGGSTNWQNNVCRDGKVQRLLIQDGSLIELSNLGKVSMVERSTLSDFIRWGAGNYPADRYGLILWDHGGGTLAGFGMDELFDGDLDLTDIAAALNTANVHFDFVGFDACLMGTLETACMLEPYADYLIASEETEPGEGWYYTDWLNALGKNSKMSIPALGKEIVDSFIASTSRRDEVTLSVIDTGEAYKLYGEICKYLAKATEQLSGNGYSKLTAARSSAKDFGEGEYDQIDIRDFINKAELDNSEAVLAALDATVIYAGTRIKNAYGLAMYFPYDYPEYYSAMLTIYNSIGMYDLSLTNFFGKFVSALNSTQKSTRSGESLSAALNDAAETTDLSAEEWYEADTEGQYADAAADLALNDLVLTEKGDGYVLQLTDEQWENISYIEMWTYVDDGEGYIELGSDNFYDFDEDGDLIADFDYYWLALDGSIVPFYAEEGGEKDDGTYYWQGFATAELAHADGTSEDVEIVLYWGEYEEDQCGIVKGYRPVSESGLTLAAKNLRQFTEGDIIVPYCSYYTYDGEYAGEYYFGDVIVWDGELEVSYEDVGEVTTEIYYYLKDIFNNEYWTEMLELSF